jgi:hypothetical protein
MSERLSACDLASVLPIRRIPAPGWALICNARVFPRIIILRLKKRHGDAKKISQTGFEIAEIVGNRKRALFNVFDKDVNFSYIL